MRGSTGGQPWGRLALNGQMPCAKPNGTPRLYFGPRKAPKCRSDKFERDSQPASQPASGGVSSSRHLRGFLPTSRGFLLGLPCPRDLRSLFVHCGGLGNALDVPGRPRPPPLLSSELFYNLCRQPCWLRVRPTRNAARPCMPGDVCLAVGIFTGAPLLHFEC